MIVCIPPVDPDLLRVLVCFKRAGHLQLNTALDLIVYLPLETHVVPLLQGLGYLKTFYQMVEKRNEVELMKNLAVRRDKNNYTEDLMRNAVFM